MSDAMSLENSLPENYCGIILNNNYSPELKQRIRDCLERLSILESLDLPILVYLAAWKDDTKTIWYEYVNKAFIELMECKPSEISGAFRNSVIDRREYNYTKDAGDVRAHAMDKQILSSARKELRQQTGIKGRTEAIYKLLLQEGRAVWLKDQADIEAFRKDRINISLGCMTIISKEMDATEEKERLIVKLKEKLAQTSS